MKKIILLMTLFTTLTFVSGLMAQGTEPSPSPAPALAKPSEPAPKFEKFRGVIDKVDEMAKSIVVKTKKEEKNFVVNDQTKITKGKETLSFAELKPGMNVSIEYKKEGDKLIASSIKVALPKGVPKK